MSELIVTHEIAPLPERNRDAHKGEVGRVVVIGGSDGETIMVGAPALAANAALRSGAGLVQMLVPARLRESVCVLAPCATARSLPSTSREILRLVQEYSTNALVIGPGLGRSLAPETIAEVLDGFPGPCVVDADAINQLASRQTDPRKSASGDNGAPSPAWSFHDPHRIVLTPHPGEARRLLDALGIDKAIDPAPHSRRAAACALQEATGCTIVLKGHNSVVTNGDRIYTNETGNAGMATAGAGDVLTGVVAALIGQHMSPFEAAVLGVYLHGLAGDFAAEELGRHAMTALDVMDYLPEAFIEHDAASSS